MMNRSTWTRKFRGLSEKLEGKKSTSSQIQIRLVHGSRIAGVQELAGDGGVAGLGDVAGSERRTGRPRASPARGGAVVEARWRGEVLRPESSSGDGMRRPRPMLTGAEEEAGGAGAMPRRGEARPGRRRRGPAPGFGGPAVGFAAGPMGA